jgi:RecB family exonuclease
MRISFSSLDNYQTCPLKYKYKEIDKIKEPKSKEQFFGTLLHQVMQYVHTPGFTSPTLENALEYYASKWDESLFENEMENRSAFAQGVDIIQRYYKDNDIARTNIVALEKRFEIEIEKDDEKRQSSKGEMHIISGIIDRIDRTENGYDIIDYKTARKMPTQENVDTSIQLSIYLLAFLDMYPEQRSNIENIQVSLYFLKHGQKLTATRTLEDLEQVRQIFLDVIGCIQKEQFEPRVSPLCDWCGYQDRCPMWRHKFENEKIENKEAQEAIEEYIKLKKESSSQRKRIAELQKTITLFMEQEKIQRVFGHSAIVEQATRQTFDYNKEALKNILEPEDRWEDVLKIDGVALRKILGEVSPSLKKRVEETKELKRETKSLVLKKRST